MSRFNALLAAGVLLLLAACSTAPPLGARFQASGLNSHFQGGQASFPEYVSASRAMLAQAHRGLGDAALQKVLDGNAPFELQPAATCPAGNGKPYRRGVLLTHGLSDSPYFMRYLAEFFQRNCFRVMAVLLPGHGTQPGDLLDVEWQDWASTVAYGTERLASEVDEVYLAGYSLGGALSVRQSLRDNRVRGLFLFSPAFKITPMAALANVHKLYSWLLPSAQWVDILPDRDIYKYESFAKNAAAQIYALLSRLNSELRTHPVSIPVFAAASQDDTTVYSSATLAFMAQAAHPANRLVLYTRTPREEFPGIPAQRLVRVDSVLPAQRILSSAHTAILLPAEDAHYGLAGEYSNCTHYYPEQMQEYAACNDHPQQDLQGERTPENLQAGVMRRLMYNPHFPELEEALQQFIAGLQ
jgi:esterase/lipase